jgi:antitoxin component of MazEF toxin-antitoxin module
MEKKLVKVGTSWAMIIPPSLLSVIGADPKEDTFKITLEGKSIIITPIEQNKK